MTEPDSKQTPLARLVLFLICLALAGSVYAGMHYGALDLPAQKSVQVPTNAQMSQKACGDCMGFCRAPQRMQDYYTCMQECELVCFS